MEARALIGSSRRTLPRPLSGKRGGPSECQWVT